MKTKETIHAIIPLPNEDNHQVSGERRLSNKSQVLKEEIKAIQKELSQEEITQEISQLKTLLLRDDVIHTAVVRETIGDKSLEAKEHTYCIYKGQLYSDEDGINYYNNHIKMDPEVRILPLQDSKFIFVSNFVQNPFSETTGISALPMQSVEVMSKYLFQGQELASNVLISTNGLKCQNIYDILPKEEYEEDNSEHQEINDDNMADVYTDDVTAKDYQEKQLISYLNYLEIEPISEDEIFTDTEDEDLDEESSLDESESLTDLTDYNVSDYDDIEVLPIGYTSEQKEYINDMYGYDIV